ncbi:MAG: FAD-binding oxidoreductase [Gaiellaceae bacterium]
MDRRELLERAGRGVLAAGVLGIDPGWTRRLWATASSDPQLSELAGSISGDVVSPGTAAYERARLLESTRFDAVRPRAVVFCESVEDVQKTLHWAGKHAVHVVPRAGGHSYGGYSTTPGVVLDVSRVGGVHVGPGKKTAVIGAGAELIDVYAQLSHEGVAIPAGSCASVGLAGLALGGGFGYGSRKLGLTCDAVRAVQVVTASGRVLSCDATHHADLFWACRGGGGGNFGVVTSFDFAVHPVSTVSTYSIEWPWAQARQAVKAWQAFAPHAPDELSSVCDLLATDPGKPGARAHVVSSWQLFGGEAALRTLIQPLASTGTPLHVATKTMSFLEAALHWAGCDGRAVAQCHLTPRGSLGRSTFQAKSDYVGQALPQGAIDRLVKAIDARQASPQLGRGSILFDAYGGAVNRVAKSATAFVHRDQLFSMQYVAHWAPGAPAARIQANRQWLRAVHASLDPFVSGQAYQNYVDPELPDWPHAYYGSNLKRLRAVKRRYDPHNFFHFPQSIRP